ncbi:NACHT domain-containing protein [Streptomyces xanthophaeus]|uniref:NACHT domain-containing protein n=1 Tax=Streptomyces xanthophaeus TaxID=67385 RepID=UPI002648A6D6|nr:NACHT domain-containing protein [Streptomyces xanthophaeus]WKD32030.1 NACHT domain-containing protein [Streptomyces xanthophaeus]
MEPGTIGIRLASAAVAPLVRKLFVSEGGGAGLVDRPIRISGHVSFTGEKRSLTEADLGTLAAKLVEQALRTGERPIATDEQQAVTDALAQTLRGLGELTMTDLDAVRLGSAAFARELRAVSGRPERELGSDATYFYERLVDAACLHILQFFTQRSTFVAHALVEQTRGIAELTAKVDELIRRDPLPGAEDAAFEQLYLPYVQKKHGKLTIYGIDLGSSPARWPLDAAYLSLEATPVTWHRWLNDRGTDAAHLSAGQALAGGSRVLLRGGARSGRTALLQWLAAAPRHALPADQALAGGHRVLLRGEAGSGKTTLVQWLAVTAACRNLSPQMEYLYDRIPFVLPLRTLTRHGERLPAPRDFLTAVGCPLGSSQPDGWAHRVLMAGRGLVLVDGIDEIPDAERERTRGWLRDLMDTYDGDNRWLVTSRPSAVGAQWLADEDFTELTLSAMTPSDIATFIQRWYAAARDGGADDADLRTYESQLLTAVRTRADLGRLATTPLMCGLICALHRDRRGYLPHGRKDLYEAALSMLLGRRDRERDLEGPDLREEPQLDLLQRLAYWLAKNGRTAMDRSRAEDVIARALPSVPEAAALGGAPEVFEYLLRRTGLLRQPAPGTVDFVHRTFQDFLGARAAVEEGDFGMLISHADDDQWEDVIRMAVALARPAERVTLLRDLLERGDASTDKRARARLHLLAAACLEDTSSIDPGTRAAVEERTAALVPPSDWTQACALAEVGRLVLGLLPGPEGLDHESAYQVVVAASHVKSDAAMPFLARFATHPRLRVRSYLLWAWSRFECGTYAEEVIAHLDPTGLLYIVSSDAQLRELARLDSPPHRLDVRHRVSLDALSHYVRRHGLTDLALTHDRVSDLDFLREQSTLESVAIKGCPQLTDISGLGGLPVRRLDLESAAPDLDLSPVAQLEQLTSFSIYGETGTRWSTQVLPAHAPLHELVVSGDTTSPRGLEGLGAFPGLTVLGFTEATGPASEADWREVRALNALAHLKVPTSSFASLPADARLTSVTGLTLLGDEEEDMRSAILLLPAAFPRLTRLFLLDMTSKGNLDIAPLAELPELQAVRIFVGTGTISGAELLPPSVWLRYD